MMSDEFFYEIFESSPIPTVILSGSYPDIVVKAANSAYMSLTGCSSQDFVGSPFLRTTSLPGMVLEDDGFQDVRKSIEKVSVDKQTVRTPVQKFSKPIAATNSFETLYFEAINTPVLTHDNQIKFIIRSLQNVTDVILSRKNERAKDALLLENEIFLSETQRVSKVGSWQIDKNYTIRWSKLQEELFEVEAGFVPTVEKTKKFFKTEEDKELYINTFREVVNTEGYFDIELELSTAKGNDRWVRITGKGEMEGGKFGRIYGITQDITERKKAEQQLVSSKTQLENLIQTIEGVVWEADMQTLELTFVSEQIQNILGYSVEESLAQPGFWPKHIHPDDKDEILKYAEGEISAGRNYTSEYRMFKKDGSLIWTSVSVSVITENGKPAWLRGLLLDITASKIITEQVQLERTVLELNAIPATPIEEILSTYLSGIEVIFPEMKCAVMRVRNGKLFNWASVSLPAPYLAALENLAVSDQVGSCCGAAHSKKQIIVSDIAADPSWAQIKQIALENGLRSCWSHPIINAAGDVVATLGIYYDTTRAPTEEELKVIERTAAILKVLIDNRSTSELLAENNVLMKQAQELAHFGSIQMEMDSRILRASDELFSIFGFNKVTHPPTIENFLKSIHPGDKERALANYKHFIEAKQDYVFEMRIVRPDNEIRHLKTWGVLKTNENGEPLKVVAAYLDITESKKIQENLAASEARLRSILDSQTNYVIRTDLTGHYTFINAKYAEDFGLDEKDNYLGTDSINTILPYDHDKVLAVVKTCISHPNQVQAVQMDKYAGDGDIKSSFWHFICLTNSHGEPAEFQCIGIDITDRKRAEEEQRKKTEELEQSEKRYSDLFHFSPQPMWVFDIDTLAFLDVNKAAVEQYGYSREEFLAMTVKDIRPEEEVPKLLESVALTKTQFDRYGRGIFNHIKKNGDIIDVEIKSRNLPAKGANARLVTAVNITERLKHLKALEHQNEKLREIAWIQSHIVRAPLTRIMGIIDLLQNYSSDPEIEQEVMLSHLLTSAHELDAVIKDIVEKSDQVILTDQKV